MDEPIPITLEPDDWRLLRPYLEPTLKKLDTVLTGETIGASVIACAIALHQLIVELGKNNKLSAATRAAMTEADQQVGVLAGSLAATLATGMRRGVWQPPPPADGTKPV